MADCPFGATTTDFFPISSELDSSAAFSPTVESIAMEQPSTRLIIRNLPPNTTSDSLTAHFTSLPSTSTPSNSSAPTTSPSARITDVKLLHRPDGTFRRFAFVGYKNLLDAQRAKEYFDSSFIGTTKITVEYAKSVPDARAEAVTDPKRKNRLELAAVGKASGSNGKPAKKKQKQGDETTPTSVPSEGTPEPVDSSTTAAKTGKGKSRQVTFDEFMAVMQPASKRKTWNNDDQPTSADAVGSKANSRRSAGAQEEDEEEVQDLTKLEEEKKRKEERKKAKKEARRAASAANTASAIAVKENIVDDGGIQTDDIAAEDAEEKMEEEGEKDAEMTDAEYLASRMRRNVGATFEAEEAEALRAAAVKIDIDESEDDEDDDSSSDSDSDQDDAGAKADDAYAQERNQRREERFLQRKQEAMKKEQEVVDVIMSSSRLLVRNLPFSTSEEELKEWFESWGAVRYVHIPVDKSSKSSKGIGFITFVEPSDALAAFRANDGRTFQGRLLHLLPAVDQHPEGAPAPVSESKKSLKERQLEEKKRRAAEGKESFSWSSFYMSADAVANSIAERMGIRKNEIVNPDDSAGTSAAVRLALAETKVIQETKEYLKSNGVDLSALEGGGDEQQQAKKANDRVILVKNFPFGTTESEIRSLFARHGDVSTVLLPPAGTFAIVEMPIANEAREAFRALAYMRFKDKPLYLEKAPHGIFVRGVGQAIVHPRGKEAPESKLAAKLGESAEEDGMPTAAAAATLFVKNLSFSTTDEGLTRAFAHTPGFVFARVQTKTRASTGRGAQQGPTKLSMGYGFVGFRSVDAAKEALQTMASTTLDGHVLSLKFAHQDASSASGSGGAAGGVGAAHGSATGKNSQTTVLVKNLPFEATKKEVRQLFEAHGQIKSVRVPRKLDKTARGFGFVEFVSRREAASAIEALKHTHLLGRHLVLKWAQEEDAALAGVGSDAATERLRRKAQLAANVGAAVPEMGGGRRAKMKLGAEDISKAVAIEKRKRDDDDDDEDGGEAIA